MRNLNHPQNIGSGIADYLLLAPVSWFAQIARATQSENVPGSLVRITDDHLMAAGRGLLRIDLAPFGNELSAKTIGEGLSKTLEQTLKFFVPGSYAILHEQLQAWLNTPLIALCRDAECATDLWYQVGSEGRAAYLTCTFSTGTEREGQKGYEVEIGAIHPFVQIYAGTRPAAIDEFTGLSAVFLAAADINRIDADSDAAIEGYYNNRVTSNINEVYNVVRALATEGILHLAYADSNGNSFSGTIYPADTSTLQAFLVTLSNWLELEGDGQYVELQENELRLFADASSAYLGIAIPRDLLGFTDTIVVADPLTFIASS